MMSFIDRIVDDRPVEGEYELTVNHERFVIRYRVPKTLQHFEQLGQDIRNFIAVTQSPAAPPEWEDYLPLSPSAAEKIKLVQLLVYEIEDANGNREPLSELDAIRFAHANGFVFLQLVTELLTRLGNSLALGEQQSLERLGEPSGATRSVAPI